MLKKSLALLLIVAMLITGLTFGATAASTEKVDGVAYTPVTTEKEFLDTLQKTADVFILLKNDIVLTDACFGSTLDFSGKKVVNGNGYSLTYQGQRVEPLFRFYGGTSPNTGEIVFQNLNFGTKSNPIDLKGNTSLFSVGRAESCLLNFQNVNFYIKKTDVRTSSAAIFDELTTVTNFEGCTLDVDFTDVTRGARHAGWVGLVSSQVNFDNCVTTGKIAGLENAAAFVGQNGGYLRFTNCMNLATVSGTKQVGGFVAVSNKDALGMYFTNCTNYGLISTTGTDATVAAGGFIAWLSNIKDEGNAQMNGFFRCSNYGDVMSGSLAGGFVGYTNEEDYAYKPYYIFLDCLNAGEVIGDKYAGGFMGVGSPLAFVTRFTGCTNVGYIRSADGYAGNFGGVLGGTTYELTDCVAAGKIDASSAAKAGVIAGQSSGKYNPLSGKGLTQTLKAPTSTNVVYYGDKTEMPKNVTKAESDEAIFAALEAVCGQEFVKADATDERAYVALAAPSIRGVQRSFAVVDGNVWLRFAAAVDGREAYSAYGFDFAVTTSEGTKTKTAYTYKLYDTLLKYKGGYHDVTADSLSAKYLFTASVWDIPLDERVIIKATPFTVSADGEKTYRGNTKLITMEDGMIVNEMLSINGHILDEFAIVYTGTDKLSEKLLATRLSDKLAELTGMVIPVFSETTNHGRTSVIHVGKTTSMKNVPTGRNISTLDATTGSIVISGDNTAQLSESVTYFLETVEEMVRVGDNAWNITEAIEVPVDTSVSLMAYNTGAKTDATIQLAEWNLIVDYLPDILTMQEPWAEWLAPFLNRYAVKPTTNFNGSSETTEAQTFKNGTGNGYYGIYWGKPRWKDADKGVSGKTTNGQASYSVILYAKDRFYVDEKNSGTFWLSPNPDSSGSIFDGSNHTRCATYATLIDKNTGEKMVVVNVHLDFDTAIKSKQITVLLTELQARVDTTLPIFITGDMNSDANDDALKLYLKNSIMKMTAMDRVATEAYRHYHIIDWLLVNHPEKVDVTQYTYCGERTFYNHLWLNSLAMGKPSDHPAIYTEFTLRKTS